jgi:hypothetical protein
MIFLLLLIITNNEAITKTHELPKTEAVFRTLMIMSREERQQYDWRNTKEGNERIL